MKKANGIKLGLLLVLVQGCSVPCPEWAKVETPEWAGAHTGIPGMAALYGTPADQPPVASIDLWQANHYIIYRPETARQLYSIYTPLRVAYAKGTLPTCEGVAARYTSGLKTDRDKAVALATKALAGERFLHPAVPPLGPACRTDRGLDEEALLASGVGWCNEQARVFVRLCQVSGIPARMIFLSYADRKRGHVVAEFYADGRWSMADATWWLVFPAADGHLMSAAECHEEGPNQQRVDQVYLARMRELIGFSDEALAGGKCQDAKDEATRRRCVADAAAGAREWLRSSIEGYADTRLWKFGVLNYPLPTEARRGLRPQPE